MKLKNFLFCGLAAILALAGCKGNEEPEQAPSISVEPKELSFEAASSAQDVTITATRAWKVDESTLPEWVGIDTDQDAAGTKKISVSVTENKGLERSASVKFTVGIVSTTLKVVQAGSTSKEYTKLSDLISKKGETIKADTYVKATVISDHTTLNNLTSGKTLYVQDESAGIQFFCAAATEFVFGDIVEIDLSGAKIAEHNKALQISDIALDKFTLIRNDAASVQAKKVSIEDFLANKYEGQYVAIDDVQVADSDIKKTWSTDNSHTSINMVHKDGKGFIVFSSKYATYRAETVAQGSGTIKGVASRNNDDIQIIFGQATDYAGLTGERFKSETTISEMTLAEFVAAEANTLASVEAVVSAVYARGIMITDGTNNMLVYEAKESAAKIGDKVKVTGKKGSYNNNPQFVSAGEDITMVEVLGSGNEVKYPDPAVVDAGNFASFEPTSSQMIQMEGQLVKSGNYYNIKISGVESGSGSISYPLASADLDSYVGKLIKVTGYSVGYGTSSSSGKYLNIMLVSIEESSSPFLSVTPLEISLDATATEAEFTISSNVAWTVTAPEGYTLSQASGEGDASIKVTFAANESTEAAKTGKITVLTTAEVTNKSYEVTITQAAALGGNALQITVDFAEKPCDDFPVDKDAGLKDENTYKIGSYDYTFKAADLYYWNSQKYLMLGKSGSYMGLPAIEGKKLAKVEIGNSSGCSQSVEVAITGVDGNAVSGGEAQKFETKSSTYTYNLSGTAVNTSYRVQVMSKHNVQIVKLVLTYTE